MPESSLQQPLFRIDECTDLMVDACVCRENGDLVFVSIWARDTAIQQFIARLTLGHDEDGLNQLHLVTEHGGSGPVFIPSVEHLEKRLTRNYRRTLFGSLTNLWLFDQRCICPDKNTASALALLPRAATPTVRLWQLVKDTCPLPLLDHWQTPVRCSRPRVAPGVSDKSSL
ncbi:hypothetical protein [Dickeya chrysanthemi]|uniref:hypothetical protein n=1 Tax=Dickeya chrysanthemi TaxID=556 RepID=UPI003DA6EAB2